MDKVNIVIPARNEEDAIIHTLESIRKKVNVPYQVIVVNDKSTDKTEEIIKKYIRKNKRVTIINNRTKKSGFCQALYLGFKKVRKGPIVFVMADLCDEPNTINKMYEKISGGFDIVCGSRYMKGGKKKDNDNPFQGMMSYLTNLTLNLIWGIPTTDMSNAFKMYKKEVLDNVVFNTDSGVEASMELVGQAFFNGAKITEVPTTWTGRKFGKSKFKILKRTPRYWRIYKWIASNRVRQPLHLKLEEFYI